MPLTRRALLLLALATCASAARADDGFVQVNGGAAALYAGEHPNISMDSETVQLSLRDDGYTVDVSFDFYNHGESTDVSVGFPELGTVEGESGGLGYLQDHRLQHFLSWVDGEPAVVKELPGDLEVDGTTASFRDFDDWYADWQQRYEKMMGPDHEAPDEAIYVDIKETRWFVKTVRFPARRHTLVRVRYDALYDAGNNGHKANYIYGTGGSWNGPIRTMTYIVEASSTAWVWNIDLGTDQVAKVRRLGEYRCAYTLHDIKPARDAQVQILVSDDHQPWEIFAETHQLNRRYADWKYATVPVPATLLETLSRRQLRLLRNTFFAGHGRRFKDPELRAYFEDRGPKAYGWYQPRDDYDDRMLSPVERENVRRIAEYEKSLKL